MSSTESIRPADTVDPGRFTRFAEFYPVEKNKPASFKRPFYSFLGDWTMYRDIWLGRVKIQRSLLI